MMIFFALAQKLRKRENGPAFSGILSKTFRVGPRAGPFFCPATAHARLSGRRFSPRRGRGRARSLTPPRSRPFLGGCLGIGLLCLLLLLGWCHLTVANESLVRYRLTVELAAPRGPRTGSGVLEARFETNFIGDHHRDYVGEAVAVDLPDGRTLFALPSWPGEDDCAATGPVAAINAAHPHGPPRATGEPLETREERSDRLSRTGATAELTESRPLFVIFGDPDDPRSARRVTPGNIGTVLGAGYAIRRVTVTVTRDEVSRGIEARLPWVTQRRETPSRFAGNVLLPPEAALGARHLTR